MATLMTLTMKHGILTGTLGFLLGIGMSIAAASVYNIDDVYRMARQAKKAAEQAQAAAEEAKEAIGGPYTYGSVTWYLRRIEDCR